MPRRRPTHRTVCARLAVAYNRNQAKCERLWKTKRGDPRVCKAARKTYAAWERLCEDKRGGGSKKGRR